MAPRFNDGEFVHIFAMQLSSGTNALTPETTGEIILSNINWNPTDYDLAVTTNVQELKSLDSIAVRNLNLEVEMYIRGNVSMSELDTALIYTPSIFFVNVMDLRDNLDDQGYPANVTVDSFPNYFGRSYGALDPNAPQASPNIVDRPPFHGANRTVLRRFQLLNGGQLNGTGAAAGGEDTNYGPSWKLRFTHTVKRRITLGPKQGLVIGVQAYNSVNNADMVMVAAVHGRFGYHRFKRDLRA